MGVKLGQKWAVKDGNLLASNQVGSRFFNKEFDFSRTTSGTYIDRDGVLQTAELYNKIEYSQDFESGSYGRTNLNVESSSVVSPDGFENAYKLIPTAVNGVHLLTNATINNAVYSVFAKQGGYKRFRLNTGSSGDGYASFDLDLGQVVQSGGTYYIDSGIEDYGNGWYRCYLAIGATSGTTTTLAMEYNSGSVAFTADGTSGIYVYGMQVVEGTEPLAYQYTNGLQGLPRISYENGVGHLLLEPQRTNSMPYGNTLSSLFSAKTKVENLLVVTDNYAISPDGTQNASRLQASAENLSGEWSLKGYTVPSSLGTGNYAQSVYLKSNTGQNQNVAFYGRGLTQSVVVTPQWQRFDGVGDTVGGNYFSYLGCRPDYGSDTEIDILVYGYQIEQGSYSTSLINTSGTAVTRNADVCNNSGSAQDFNSEEGVLYAEFQDNFLNEGSFRLISINNAASDSDANSVTIGFKNTGDFYFRVKSPSGTYTSQLIDANLNEFYKVALKYKSGDIAIWINGVEVDTDTTAFSFAAILDNLSFDYNGNGGLPFYGKAKNLQVFTEALGDTELMTLTGGDGSLNGLFTAYKSRVEADGGYLEAETCLINELKELL